MILLVNIFNLQDSTKQICLNMLVTALFGLGLGEGAALYIEQYPLWAPVSAHNETPVLYSKSLKKKHNMTSEP